MNETVSAKVDLDSELLNRNCMTTIKHRIWNDLLDCKKYDEYVIAYLARVKDWNARYRVLLTIGTFLGGVSYFWDAMGPLIACGVLTLIQLGERLVPMLSTDEKTIKSISEYRLKYFNKFEKLDKLWCELTIKNLDPTVAFDRYFEIRDCNIDIETLDNDLRIKIGKRTQKKADKKALIFIENHYYTQNP